jgi:hypothetical protein
MTIYIKQLTYEERATWGTCPVCEAQHGKQCEAAPADIDYFQFDGAFSGFGAHAARLYNAPHAAAISDESGVTDG